MGYPRSLPRIHRQKRPGRDQHRRRGFRVLSGTPPRAQAFRRNQLHPPPARRHLLPHQVLRAARPVVDQLQRQEDEASPRQGRPQGRVRRARPSGHRRSAHQRRHRLRRGGLRYPHGRFPYHPRRGGHHLHGRHQPPLQQPFRHELQHMDVPRRHRRRRSHEPAGGRGTRQHRIPAHDRGAPQLQRRRAQRPLRHGGRAHQRQG